MLFIATSSTCPQSHAISSVALSVSPVLNRMFSMGTSDMNEKILRMADRMLKTTDSTRYFLYGGTNRRSTCRNSLIC